MIGHISPSIVRQRTDDVNSGDCMYQETLVTMWGTGSTKKADVTTKLPAAEHPQSCTPNGNHISLIPRNEYMYQASCHAWKRCCLCKDCVFINPKCFIKHLREYHCRREGTSFLCQYATGGTCIALGNDRDYEDHIVKEHLYKDLAIPHQSSAIMSSMDVDNGQSIGAKTTWTILNCTQNLTAVLNDPRKRRETDLFSKSWGESFEKVEVGLSPYVIDIGRDDFKAYLVEVAPKLHQKRRDIKLVPVNKHDTEQRDKKSKTKILPEELNQIPQIFFESEFNLQNQKTFEAVIPWSEVKTSSITAPAPSNSSMSKKLHQEKLSHYLDIIEIAISNQISHRAESFFHAMSSHDDVQDNLIFTCLKTKALREQLQKIQRDLVGEPLKLLQSRIKRRNYVKVFNKLKLMATVYQTQPTVQILLSTSDFVGALDLIDTTKDVLVQELSGVHCFRHLTSQLIELEHLIDKMMSQDFSRHIARDLLRPVEDGGSGGDEEQLVILMLGMVRQSKFSFTDTYRQEACTALKTLLKQTVIQAVSNINSRSHHADVDGSAISLAKEVSQLNFDQWLELIEQIFANLTVLIKRVKAAHSMMREIADTAIKVEAPTCDVASGQDESLSTVQRHMTVGIDNDSGILISADEHSTFTASIDNMLHNFCDQLGERASRIISARFKDNYAEKLPAHDFLSVFRTVDNFYNNCERISDIQIKTLTAVLFTIRTNGCRGYCQSLAYPSPPDMLALNPNHVLTSKSQCCTIGGTTDIEVTAVCIDGPRNLIFKSATSCRCGFCKKG